MPVSPDDQILECLKRLGARTAKEQVPISLICESTGLNVETVVVNVRRLLVQNDVDVSSRQIRDSFQYTGGAKSPLEARQEHDRRMGTILVWLGPKTVKLIEAEERERERDELMRRQTKALERAVEQHTAIGSTGSALGLSNAEKAPDRLRESRAEARLEGMAYVFIDVVGFTHNRSSDAQANIIGRLNIIVFKAIENCSIDHGEHACIFLPTGDGMCISLMRRFLPTTDAHLLLALQILQLTDEDNADKEGEFKFTLRVGVDQHSDLLVTDINGRLNVAGTGINRAQRVMSAGESGHLLASQNVPADISGIAKYRNKFHDGTVEVKHGQLLNVSQYRDYEAKGLNSSAPDRFREREPGHGLVPPELGESNPSRPPTSPGFDYERTTKPKQNHTIPERNRVKVAGSLTIPVSSWNKVVSARERSILAFDLKGEPLRDFDCRLTAITKTFNLALVVCSSNSQDSAEGYPIGLVGQHGFSVSKRSRGTELTIAIRYGYNIISETIEVDDPLRMQLRLNCSPLDYHKYVVTLKVDETDTISHQIRREELLGFQLVTWAEEEATNICVEFMKGHTVHKVSP